MTLMKGFVFFLTFLCYASYHAARRPFGIVSPVLRHHCVNDSGVGNGSSNRNDSSDSGNHHRNASKATPSKAWCGWPPFDRKNGMMLIGAVDYGFLAAYALGLYASGYLAERNHMARFMGTGMVLVCVFNLCLGAAFFLDLHSFAYFFVFQVLHGLAQTTGWPVVVGIFSNWFDETNRGLLMGLWNAHTITGNIVGAVLASLFVDTAWGWSFFVPGFIIGLIGIVAFFFLPPSPPEPKEEEEDEKRRLISGDDYNDQNEDDEEGKQKAAASAASAAAANSATPHPSPPRQPVTFFRALAIPGVIHFSVALFFNKLGVYTFLFWLPQYINQSTSLSPRDSGFLSVAFDIGGFFGGVSAGAAADATQKSAVVCIAMSILAVPCILLFDHFIVSIGFATTIFLLSLCGFFLNGPFCLITTNVSADLGTSDTLEPNMNATSTVTGIIDGSGSIGAALSPLAVGLLVTYGGWKSVFWMLATTSSLSAASLIPLAIAGKS